MVLPVPAKASTRSEPAGSARRAATRASCRKATAFGSRRVKRSAVSRVRDDGLAFEVGRPGQSGREEEELDAAVCGTGGQRVRRPPVRAATSGRSASFRSATSGSVSEPEHPRRTRSELSEEQPERTFRADTFGYFHTARATGSRLEAGAAIVDDLSVTAYRGPRRSSTARTRK